LKTIGTVTKTYGFEGAVVVRSESGIAREPINGEPVFIVIDGIPVPFFTREAFASSNETLVISFDDYLTEKSVLPFKGCEVRYAAGDNHKEKDNDFTGYQIIDDASGFKGVITSLTTSHGQILAEVKSGDSEILIPLHSDLIKKIDRKQHIISMLLPSGLTSINE